MDKTIVYSYEMKKKLAQRISKVKKKDDLIKIYEIIYSENKDSTESGNGLYLYFQNLSDNVYNQIENYLRYIRKRDTQLSDSINSTDKKEFSSYTKDEFPSQHIFSPKYKFSNQEKNIIKRQMYNKALEKESEESSSYKEININQSDSENVSEKNKKSSNIVISNN